MVTSQQIRRARLMAEKEDMKRISCPAIQWISVGDPPTRYEVTFRIRSIVDPCGPDHEPVYRDEHKIIIDIPSGYPLSGESPTARMHPDYRSIFHPNFWPGGIVCIWGGGSTAWNPLGTIAVLCVQLAKMLQFDETVTAETHRANPQAADWYGAHKHSGLFPTDKQLLPMLGASDGDSTLETAPGEV